MQRITQAEVPEGATLELLSLQVTIIVAYPKVAKFVL
jgi:hypothetical protein